MAALTWDVIVLPSPDFSGVCGCRRHVVPGMRHRRLGACDDVEDAYLGHHTELVFEGVPSLTLKDDKCCGGKLAVVGDYRNRPGRIERAKCIRHSSLVRLVAGLYCQ